LLDGLYYLNYYLNIAIFKFMLPEVLYKSLELPKDIFTKGLAGGIKYFFGNLHTYDF